MTVAQAKTVFRFRPTFGNRNQIQARNLLRLVAYLEERLDLDKSELQGLSYADVEQALADLGYDAARLLRDWDA